MSNLSDQKPVACAGEVMRRSDSHVLGNNKVSLTRHGDQYKAAPIRNFALTTIPDNDPRWGMTGCEQCDSDAIVTKDGSPLVTEILQDDIIQE